jgi:hypothetical protein
MQLLPYEDLPQLLMTSSTICSSSVTIVFQDPTRSSLNTSNRGGGVGRKAKADANDLIKGDDTTIIVRERNPRTITLELVLHCTISWYSHWHVGGHIIIFTNSSRWSNVIGQEDFNVTRARRTTGNKYSFLR